MKVTVEDVLSELRKELPPTPDKSPAHWKAYEKEWGIRKFVVEQCISRVEELFSNEEPT